MLTGDGTVSIVRTMIGPDPALSTLLALSASVNTPQYATGAFYTATLSQGSMPLTGSVVFALNGAPFALQVLTSLTASATTAMALGPNRISATYSGDDHYAPATAALDQTAVKATTSVSATSAGPRFCGQEVYLNAYLNAPRWNGLAEPSSVLTFREGATPLQVRADPRNPVGWFFIAGLETGTHQITVEFAGDANYEPSSKTITQIINPSLDATISAGGAVYANESGYASVIPYSASSFVWTVTNGTIDTGQGTAAIRYTAGASGEVTLAVTVSMSGGTCATSATRTVSILQRAPGASLLHMVNPCRALDTRDSVQLGANGKRDVALGGICSVPAGATAVVVNLTVIAPASDGWMSLYPTGAVWPGRARSTIAPGGRARTTPCCPSLLTAASR